MITLDTALEFSVICMAVGLTFYFVAGGIAALKFTGKITTAIEKVTA
jgi:hypothetical protein